MAFILLSVFFFLISVIEPSGVWAQACSVAGGTPPSCNLDVLCYNSSERKFYCCISMHDAAEMGCSDIIGDVSGGYTAETCQGINDFFKTLPDTDPRAGVTLTYVAIFRGCMDLNQFLNQAIMWAVMLSGVMALVRLAFGSYQYVSSSGDPTELEEARGVIIYAVVGLLIVAVAYLIMKLGSEFAPEEWKVWFGVG